MNPATFCQNASRIVTGKGFKRVIQGININTIRTDGGIIPTASTNPSRTAVETSFDALVIASSQTSVGYLTFGIPRDYDETVDKLHFRFLAQSAGTDVPTIDGAIYRKRAGAALSADLDPTISAAINTATALADWVEVVSQGDGHKAGDAICANFTTSAHTSHAVHIYDLEVVYASNLAYFDKTDRSIADE